MSKTHNAHRLFEVRDGQPTTLFHGVDGDRTLPFDQWIEADVKEVHDGSGGTTYQSGFHVTKTPQDSYQYLERFQKERPLVVCAVYVQDMWAKSHSPDDVYLARHMYIPAGHWLEAHNPVDNPMRIPEGVRNSKRKAAARAMGQNLEDMTTTARPANDSDQ